MKKVVFRRKSLWGPIRVFVYEQSQNEIMEGGSKKDFSYPLEPQNEKPRPGQGRVHLYDLWSHAPKGSS